MSLPQKPLDLLTIPCLRDNYAFLLRDPETGRVALVDAPEAGPILQALDDFGGRLDEIVLTHHHNDHIDGVAELVAKTGAKVIGAAADAHRLPPLDLALAPDDWFDLCDQSARVIDVSGHTLGHIALHLPQAGLAFTGDSLMAMGCGRLFEGSPAIMWQSLLRLRALPGDTQICSGHEYTAANARFAQTIEPGNSALTSRVAAITAARAEGRPTVPSRLDEEIATNPFLRADKAEMKSALGMADAEDAAVFGALRAAKDRF